MGGPDWFQEERVPGNFAIQASGRIRKIERIPSPLPTSLALMVKQLKTFKYRPESCVYFLIENSEVIYVGQSVNLAARLSGHREKCFDQVLYMPVARDKMNEVERTLIRSLQPRLNCKGIRG